MSLGLVITYKQPFMSTFSKSLCFMREGEWRVGVVRDSEDLRILLTWAHM